MGDPAPEVRYILLGDVGIMQFGRTYKNKAFAFEWIVAAILKEVLKSKIKT